MRDCEEVRWFEDIGLGDVAVVGGKTASLGELYNKLVPKGVKVPNGFALTAEAYRHALTRAGAWRQLASLMKGAGECGLAELSRRARKARVLVYTATGTPEMRSQVGACYRALELQYGPNVSVAVRSSATAEDLPGASFAGQHESYINVRGETAVYEAVRHCFASLFTDRAILYRARNGFDHLKIALSVAVMKMVRSDRACSGVIFTLDTESGFRDVVLVTGSYGLGETIVQGRVDPDEFYVHKPTFRNGHRAVLRHVRGRKQECLVIGSRGAASTTKRRRVSRAQRLRYCLEDDDILQLTEQALLIEEHYSNAAGHLVPMDIEWAKDGFDGQLYIVQARPETVASQRTGATLQSYALKEEGSLLAQGKAIGEKIVAGRIHRIASKSDLKTFRNGEILVADATTPDWEPVMKRAAGIVTGKGGRTCHAAIVAREMGIPAVVGIGVGLRNLKPGAAITVSCAQGDVGRIYRGKLPYTVSDVDITGMPRPRTQIMVNLGDPDLAFQTAMLPNDGVGLARMEFIINEFIGVHPMALAEPKRVRNPKIRARIAALARGHARPADFFVERLAEGIGVIAAAFYPKPVIVRLSDFKTNEYAALLGGSDFEPLEENPMLGFRGASRYAHPNYAPGFALECRALKRVREEFGLTNLRIMVPFCRREEEAARVIAAMKDNGLARGVDGLEIFVMCEIPNNVIRIDAFSRFFDGFSIGSNDLTQLTLGVDRDSHTVAFDFDERDPGMLEMLRLAVTGAKRNRRHVGICGEAPANYPEIAQKLAGWGIDSISVNPASLIKTFRVVAASETQQTALAAAS